MTLAVLPVTQNTLQSVLHVMQAISSSIRIVSLFLVLREPLKNWIQRMIQLEHVCLAIILVRTVLGLERICVQVVVLQGHAQVLFLIGISLDLVDVNVPLEN